MIHTGDCVEVMADMEPDSIDAIVTDPPYGLEFMGKEWDRLDGKMSQPGIGARPTSKQGVMQQWHQRWATEALRVAKPGAYLLAFGGTRTVHRLTVALEDAGWIIRDLLVWAYAQGFPKSKASLKPAWEPIVLARKPGPLQELDIDGCRIGFAGEVEVEMVKNRSGGSGGAYAGALYGDEAPGYRVAGERFASVNPAGRWPANVVLTDPIFDGDTEGVVGGGEANRWYNAPRRDGADHRAVEGTSFQGFDGPGVGYGDTGTYSRFFLIPKAGRSDREPIVPGDTGGDEDDLSEGKKRTIPRQNTHPTVKPTRLMRHLVRLVTPKGGTVLDPFLGSGTTALAAEAEGFDWVGIEREAEYARVAEQRLELAQRGLGL